MKRIVTHLFYTTKNNRTPIARVRLHLLVHLYGAFLEKTGIGHFIDIANALAGCAAGSCKCVLSSALQGTVRALRLPYCFTVQSPFANEVVSYKPEFAAAVEAAASTAVRSCPHHGRGCLPNSEAVASLS